MKKIQLTLIVTCIVITFTWRCTSTEGDKDPLHFFTDMEQYDGFAENIVTHKMQDAFSGEYVSRVNAASPYSITFRKKMGDISSKPLKSVEVSAYLYAEKLPVKTVVVCDVQDESKSVNYQSSGLEKLVLKEKEWTKVKAVFKFPGTLNAANKFIIYCWNTENNEVMIDNMDIKFITE